MIHHAAVRSRAYAKDLVQAVRTVLRFLAAEGWCSAALVTAVPSIPQRRSSSLLPYLETDAAEQVIDCRDLSELRGLRIQDRGRGEATVDRKELSGVQA